NERPEVLVRKGMAHVPQGRRLFGTISVEKNLLLGAYLRRDREVRDDVARVLDYFPTLKNKLSREAGTLSGGEQQMLAIARGMMARPSPLMTKRFPLAPAPNGADALLAAARTVNPDATAPILAERACLSLRAVRGAPSV